MKKKKLLRWGSALTAALVAACIFSGCAGSAASFVQGEDSGDASGWVDAEGNEYEADGQSLPQAQAQATGSGVSFMQATFCDSSSGLPVFRSVIPEGWTTNASLTQMYDMVYPLRAVAVATSADGTRQFGYYSPNAMVQIVDSNWQDYQSGITSSTDYKIYQDYMDAPTWCDYVIQADFSGGSLVEDREMTPDQVAPAQEYARNLAQGYQTSNDMQIDTVTDAGASCAYRTYQISNGGYVTVMPIILYFTFHTVLTQEQVAPLGLYSDTTIWMPITFLSYAQDTASLAEQEDAFDMFISNGVYAPELTYVSTQMRGQIQQAIAERDAEKLRITSEAISGAYNSYDGSGTTDRVAEMWDDVILDQDNYTTSDGNSVKVSTDYDYVYDNGSGGVYATDSALDDPGVGWTPMSPSY